jgi:hypothetical protein
MQLKGQRCAKGRCKKCVDISFPLGATRGGAQNYKSTCTIRPEKLFGKNKQSFSGKTKIPPRPPDFLGKIVPKPYNLIGLALKAVTLVSEQFRSSITLLF